MRAWRGRVGTATRVHTVYVPGWRCDHQSVTRTVVTLTPSVTKVFADTNGTVRSWQLGYLDHRPLSTPRVGADKDYSDPGGMCTHA